MNKQGLHMKVRINKVLPLIISGRNQTQKSAKKIVIRKSNCIFERIIFPKLIVSLQIVFQLFLKSSFV